MATPKAQVLDFTNVSEGGGRFTRTHKVPGDYRAKITKVESAKTKQDGKPMWLYTFKVGSATYPYYCQFAENVLWKIRTLFAAAGVSIPSKKVNLNPEKIVGREIGVSLDDHEYDNKLMSEVIAVFPTSELSDEDTSDDEEGDEEEEEDEEDETEEEEDEEEDEEEEPPPPPKTKKGKKNKEKTKRKSDVSDEELEELDIEDI